MIIIISPLGLLGLCSLWNSVVATWILYIGLSCGGQRAAKVTVGQRGVLWVQVVSAKWAVSRSGWFLQSGWFLHSGWFCIVDYCYLIEVGGFCGVDLDLDWTGLQ